MQHGNFWRALSLSLLGALSLLALSAASAQAGLFKVNLKELLALITGSQVGESLFLVPARNLTIKCSTGKLESGSEIINGHEALIKIEFSGCLAFLHKPPFNHIPCKIHNFLFTAKGFPKLHPANHPLILFEPDVKAGATHTELLNALFGHILFLEETCPLPELNPVRGAIVALVDNNHTSKPRLLFTHALQALAESALGDKVLFGTFPASLQATVDIEATGAHLGASLGVL